MHALGEDVRGQYVDPHFDLELLLLECSVLVFNVVNLLSIKVPLDEVELGLLLFVPLQLVSLDLGLHHPLVSDVRVVGQLHFPLVEVIGVVNVLDHKVGVIVLSHLLLAFLQKFVVLLFKRSQQSMVD